MTNTQVVSDLFSHMEWADACVWTSVLACPDAVGDAKLNEYLYHLHMVQWAFLRAWRGEAIEAPFPKFESARPMMQWCREYYRAVRPEISAFDEARVAQPMPVPWSALVEKRTGRKPETTTIGETAVQVAMHSTYHRGQVNARLRAVGGTPPLVDYIGWLWLGRPGANWPMA